MRSAGPSLLDVLRDIAGEAERRELVVRAFGSVAFRLHAADPEIFARLGRPEPNDLDLVGVSAQRREYKRLFEDLGYAIDRDLEVSAQGRRFGFEREAAEPVHVDLFIDRLEMCHTIDLRDRLTLQPDTVPLADLLLQKLQIVEINRKDVVDAAVLLAGHELGPQSPETIDAGYVAGLLAEDWGFWYTVTENLAHVEAELPGLGLDAAAAGRVAARLRELRAAIDERPKTRRWKLRAKIGTKKQWYTEVGEGTDAF